MEISGDIDQESSSRSLPAPDVPTMKSRYFTRSESLKAIVGAEVSGNSDNGSGGNPLSKRTLREAKRRRISPTNRPGAERQEVLHPVPDIIVKELDILFCGINPGETSSRKGHHFSHPSNRFWPSLYAGGLTPVRMIAAQDTEMPLLDPSMGLTNLCDRPSKEEKDLEQDEHKTGAAVLIHKIHEWRPRIVAFAGFGIWDKFIGAVDPARPRDKKLRLAHDPYLVLPYKIVHRAERDAKSEPPRRDPSIKTEQEDEPVMTVLPNKPPVTE
ncbi:uracil-DNA glycosylase-like protein, partial [Cantharellus anzutake]|uniref:uracil-DNA glycosylase-like protein n=1 Tax=Cantharellus anzutake TaxID=1750568 RepID=UPI0019073025